MDEKLPRNMHKPLIMPSLVFFQNSRFPTLFWLEKGERVIGKLFNETKEVWRSLGYLQPFCWVRPVLAERHSGPCEAGRSDHTEFRVLALQLFHSDQMNPDWVHLASEDDKKDREGDTFNSIVILRQREASS
jgi:hypothetical protein